LSLKTLRDFSIDMVVLHLNFNQSNLSLKTLRDFSIDMVVLHLNFNQSNLSLKTLRDFSIDMVVLFEFQPIKFVFENFKRFFN
jgi:hypothetical protein